MMRSTGTEPKNVSWGLNTNTLIASITDISNFVPAPEARVVGVSSVFTTTTTNDTYQVTGTLTAAAAQTVGEIALHDSTTKPPTAVVAVGGGTVVGSPGSTTLNTTAVFSPGNGNYIQIRTEVMQVTAGSGSTALTVVRARNGSSAISNIAAGDVVTQGNPPGQTGVTGGSMYLHGDFTGVPLNTGDSIQFIIQIRHQ